MLLTRHVLGDPEDEGRLTAQVLTVAGHLVDLADPNVVDQADEISADLLELAERTAARGDAVLAIDDIGWFAPFNSVEFAIASLAVIDRALVGSCDRMVYILGRHLRLVSQSDNNAPEVEHRIDWWQVRGWTHVDAEIIARPCRRL